MMSRASLVRCSCPWRVKLIFPQTHLPCLTSIWVMSTAVSGNQRPTGCGPGPAKRSPRIVRGSPPAMSIPPPAMSIALRQSQMDIFDFILIFTVAEAASARSTTNSGPGRLPCSEPPRNVLHQRRVAQSNDSGTLPSASPGSSFFESWGSSRSRHISSNRSLNPPGFSDFCQGASPRSICSVSSLTLFFASSSSLSLPHGFSPCCD